MRDLNVSVIEVDEAWSFIAKKQKRVRDTDPREFGDSYTWIALDANRKAIISYRVGKRTIPDATAFMTDLRGRVANRPQITSDGYAPYLDAVEYAFGHDVDYAMLQKVYGGTPEGADAARRYSPGAILGVEKTIVTGDPDESVISTSYVERQNLTLRMQIRRFTRLTNGFSKKLESHRAAVSLHVAWYNLCRVHETIRCTPAMELRITDHVWSIRELIDRAMSTPAPAPIAPKPRPTGMSAARSKGEKRGSGPSRWLRVIKGGKGGGK